MEVTRPFLQNILAASVGFRRFGHLNFFNPTQFNPFSILMAQTDLIELEKGVKPIWLAPKLGLVYVVALTSSLLHLTKLFWGDGIGLGLSYMAICSEN